MASATSSYAEQSAARQTSPADAQKTTRNRKAYSCTECRRRKKHCDRRVPGCNQCVLRGTVHLCRWGDQRDGTNHVERPNPASIRASRQPSASIEPGRRSLGNGSRLPSLHEQHDFALYHPPRSRSTSPFMATIGDPRGIRTETSHIRGELAATLANESSIVSFIGQANEPGQPSNASRTEALLREEDNPGPTTSVSPAARSHANSINNGGLYHYNDASRDTQPLIMTELSAAERSMGIGSQHPDEAETPMTSVSSRTSNEQRARNGSDHSQKRTSKASTTSDTHSAQNVDFSQASRKRTRYESGSTSSRNSTKSILTFTQANELYHLYLTLANRLLVFDQELISNVLKDAMSLPSPYKSDDTVELLHRSPDTYALLLTVCASALSNMPPTYAITMGLIGRSDELTELLNVVSTAATKALDTLPSPTFIAIQTHNLFQHNLTAILSVKDHVLLKDKIIREARFLGLDRLGSPEDDEAMWKKRDRLAAEKRLTETPGQPPKSRQPSDHIAEAAQQLGFGVQGNVAEDGHPQRGFAPAFDAPHQSSRCSLYRTDGDIMWAADTFQRRDRNARNLGRCHWMFLRAKDWVTSRLSGCYMIAADSYTTSLPRPYAGYDKNVISEHDALIFKYLEVALSSSRRTTDLVAEAQSTGEVVDYDKILELDAELIEALDSRPPSLRPEEDRDPLATKGESLFVTSTLWHRLFVLHRPYLISSQTDPERYGLSALRSWDYALLTIKTVREASKGMTKYWPPLHFRVLQAALVVISHLFIWPHRMTLAQTIAIHDELNWVVNNLKSLGSMNGNTSVFAGTSDRLEALLAAASRIKRARGLNAPHDKDCSIGGMAAPWMGQGFGGDVTDPIDLSNSAMQHAAQLASQARQRKDARGNLQRATLDQMSTALHGSEGNGHAYATWPMTQAQDIGGSNGYEQQANGAPSSYNPTLLPDPALGALDMQLVRLMGEGTIGWQERVPSDAPGAAAVNLGIDTQATGTNADAANHGNYTNSTTSAPPAAYAVGSGMGRPPLTSSFPVTPSSYGQHNSASNGNGNGTGYGNSNGNPQQDLWAELFAYVDAAAASVPRSKPLFPFD